MEIRYPARLEPQKGGGYFVNFPDFADTFTEGDSEEEALYYASEVLTVMLETKIAHDLPIAVPSPAGPGERLISPDAKTQAALLVRFARGPRALADLARALGTSWPAAKRLEDPGHWPSLKSLERAAAALGQRLVLSFEETKTGRDHTR
jgi:antitoxin HicB